MKLVDIDHPREGQAVQCCHCGNWVPAREAKADLDGTPFLSYYCDDCAIIVTSHIAAGYTSASFVPTK